MADFINTVDALGDDVVIDGIIDRSIVEFKDDSIKSIPINAFRVCKNLVSVSLPNVTTLSLGAFRECTSLTTIDFPNLTTITGDSKDDANGTFRGCSSLVEVNLPKVTSAGNGAFRHCTKLETLNIPFTTGVDAQGCTSLKSINFPYLSVVGWRNFLGCSGLQTVILPKATTIGGQSFMNCSSLKSFVLASETICTLDASAFPNSGIAKGTGYVYVPRALVDSYKAATNWSVYAAQFRALEDYTVDGTITGELDESKI